jgi:excisionase family DNA binding protein
VIRLDADDGGVMDRPVPVKEAARLAGVSRQTVWAWVKKGAVPAYQTPSGALRVVPRDCLPVPRPAAKR